MYGRCGRLDEALQIFTSMEERNIYSWNLLLTAYAHNEDYPRAKLVFDQIPARDEVSWNILIAAYARRGHDDGALLLLALMDLDGVPANQFTFLSALEACESIRQGRIVHGLVAESGMEDLVIVSTAVVTMYGKLGRVDSAKKTFDRMPHKNVITWNAMLAVYAQSGYLDEAKLFFELLPSKDVYSWTTIIAALGEFGYLEEARNAFDKMPRRNVVSWNAMAAAYATNGHLEEAKVVFNLTPNKNTASWNSMISGYAQHGNEEAIHLFRLMDLASDPAPNRITFISALNACACWSWALIVGKAIHDHLVATTKVAVLDVTVATSLVNMYGKCGDLDQAREIFNAMPAKGFVTWNAMLAAYAQHGHAASALDLFHLMNLDGVSADDITFTSVLAACSHLGSLSRGLSYFADIAQSFSIAPTCEHYLCMIDLLGRAGQAEEAADLVHAMPFEPSSVALTMAVGACGVNGDPTGGKSVVESMAEDRDPAPYLVLSNIHVTSQRNKSTAQG
ncbi:pentatricopeptide repeat-containing protein At2g13600 [Selaginella moellendorffii]|uniref:pentatricopeptide repeat-containing protein At2g13600 n=1 Tax=Selaginella moellendorffii TaxID=88036 RepID=UPI000D1D019E|nr:pentatricopeptide repeat-containing protein At2g13600 [Selaginella moellendorffii]|eukprot:XP_024532137.1 pentatricopeptide repeat-containing protein At2g13600 [Selaginella moellendorffii]